MELWLTLLALYAWQCAVRLPEGSALFGPRWAHPDARPQRGLQWLSPWPSRLGVTPTRMPFHVSSDGEALVAHIDASRGGSPAASSGARVDLDDTIELEARGSKLIANGDALVASASKAQVRAWQEIAQFLARAPRAERERRWTEAFARTLDVDALELRLSEALHHTRWIGWICDGILVLTLAVVPLLGTHLGAERILTLAWPGLLLLHLFAWVCAILATHRLDVTAFRLLVGDLMTALLYPPALLRLPALIVDGATAGFHPLAWSRTIGTDIEASRTWRRELAWLEARAKKSPDQAHWLLAARDAIRLAQPDAFWAMGPMPSIDPNAESYCPVCLDEFRSGFEVCEACETPTLRFLPRQRSDEPATAPRG